MGEKLLKLMKSEGLTSSRLAELLGTGASNISHIISGRSKPGYDLLRKILLRFPRINPDWLLLDDDTMYRKDESPETAASSSADLFSAENASVSASTNRVLQETAPSDISSAPVVDRQRHVSDEYRNLTSPSVQRIIVVYTDRTFESFTPKQE